MTFSISWPMSRYKPSGPGRNCRRERCLETAVALRFYGPKFSTKILLTSIQQTSAKIDDRGNFLYAPGSFNGSSLCTYVHKYVRVHDSVQQRIKLSQHRSQTRVPELPGRPRQVSRPHVPAGVSSRGHGTRPRITVTGLKVPSCMYSLVRLLVGRTWQVLLS